MPLRNTITNNEYYTIDELIIKPEEKLIFMRASYIKVIGGVPSVKSNTVTISDNPQDMILDPSYQPTPEFSYEDPATWGEIDPATFPKILNVNTQYFTNLVSNVTSGESLISEITSVALNTLKQKLGLSEDWTVI